MNPFRDSSFSVPFGFALSNAALDPYANPFAEAIYAGLAGRERARLAKLEEEERERQRKRQEELDQRAREAHEAQLARDELVKRQWRMEQVEKMRGAREAATASEKANEAFNALMGSLNLNAGQAAAAQMGRSGLVPSGLATLMYKGATPQAEEPLSEYEQERLRNLQLRNEALEEGDPLDLDKRRTGDLNQFNKLLNLEIELLKGPLGNLSPEQQDVARLNATQAFRRIYGREPFDFGETATLPGGRIAVGDGGSPPPGGEPSEADRQQVMAALDAKGITDQQAIDDAVAMLSQYPVETVVAMIQAAKG